jgi:hypothetical protein
MLAAAWLRIRLPTSRINTLMQTHADIGTLTVRGPIDGPAHTTACAWATPAQLLLLPR